MSIRARLPLVLFLSLILLATGLALSSVQAASATVTLVSKSILGSQTANADSSEIRPSADGRYVVFTSRGSDAASGVADNNGRSDVFRRNLATGVTECVSVVPAGNATGNDESFNPVVSADGRYVAFVSRASNLTAVPRFSQEGSDVLVRDMQTGVTVPVSIAAGGLALGDGSSQDPQISADGRYVAFSSYADDLTATPDENFDQDVFLRDLATNTTQIASVNSAGTAASDGRSWAPSLSADGRRVAFLSGSDDITPEGVFDGNDATDVFVRDFALSVTQTATVDSTGAATADGEAYECRISANGGVVVFVTSAGNLAAGLTANHISDVYARDLSTGVIDLVSVNAAGTGEGNSASAGARVSADGQIVAFVSQATNLVSGYGVTEVDQAYVRDRTSRTTTLVSHNAAGTAYGNNNSSPGDLSADGRFLAFDSSATDLLPGLTDVNGTYDAFIWNRQSGVTSLISVNAAGTGAGNGFSGYPAFPPNLSANGRVAAFISLATNLTADADANEARDVFAAIINSTPVAKNDTYNANQDTKLDVSVPGVLGNDTDDDGDPLTASQVTGPAHGSLKLNGDGSFTYTPDAGYNGPDSFTYRISDGQAQSNTATVTLAVQPTPLTPADHTYSTRQGKQLDLPDGSLQLGATGGDGSPISVDQNVVLIDAPGATLAGAGGLFSYKPANTFLGPAKFQYRLKNNQGFSSYANITVNIVPDNKPVAVDDAYSTPQNTKLTVSFLTNGLLKNDTDADNDALTAVKVTNPAHGTLNTFSTTGSFSYTPNPGYVGTDSFTYRASDGVLNSTAATVTITVFNPNQPPAANADSYTVTPGQTLSVTAAAGVLKNDTDADNNPLTAVLKSTVSHGSLNLKSDGSFTYTANGGFSGTDSFTYAANDGTTDGNTATVTLTVPNAAPVAVADRYSTPEDTKLTVSAAQGVLANDTDTNNDPLTVKVGQNVQHGSLQLNSDGGFTYTPNSNYNGPDSFTYTVNDGKTDGNTVTVSLTVTPVNDPPVAVGESYAAPQATPLTVNAPGVLGNDTDVDSDALTAQLVTGPAHGSLALNGDGSFTYTAQVGYSGPDMFTYRASDGAAQSNVATVTLNVSANPPPGTVPAKVTGVGSVLLNGQRVTFNFAVSSASPSLALGSLTVRFMDATVLTASQFTALVRSGKHARIYGKGKLGPAGTPVSFVIDLDDGVEGRDQFGLRMSNGYTGAPMVLGDGSVTVQ